MVCNGKQMAKNGNAYNDNDDMPAYRVDKDG